MKATMQGTVLGVSSVTVERDTFTSIFLSQPAAVDSSSSKGMEVMKVSCDVDVFNALPRDGYPLECSLEVEFKKAAGGKMGQHVVKASPVRAAAKAS